METVEDANRLLVFPPNQDYGVPEKKVNLSVAYFDNPWLWRLFREDDERSILTGLYLEKSKGEKSSRNVLSR